MKHEEPGRAHESHINALHISSSISLPKQSPADFYPFFLPARFGRIQTCQQQSVRSKYFRGFLSFPSVALCLLTKELKRHAVSASPTLCLTKCPGPARSKRSQRDQVLGRQAAALNSSLGRVSGDKIEHLRSQLPQYDAAATGVDRAGRLLQGQKNLQAQGFVQVQVSRQLPSAAALTLL